MGVLLGGRAGIWARRHQPGSGQLIPTGSLNELWNWVNNAPKQGWDGIRLLGEDVPARPRLCSLQSSESDPDSPPSPSLAFDPRLVEIPSGIICRT